LNDPFADQVGWVLMKHTNWMQKLVPPRSTAEEKMLKGNTLRNKHCRGTTKSRRSWPWICGGNEVFTPPSYRRKSKSFYVGLKKYELTNDLGNVISVVADRKTVKFNDFILIEELRPGHTYQADVVSAKDCYPFF
jgi:hypothetical protein